MPDANGALDAYLASRFGLSLERLLAAATAGCLEPGLRDAIEIACDPVGCFAYEDGGLSEQYQGLLVVEGVTYRFRCSVFTDGSGARFVESVEEMEPVRWQARLALR
jgi:hypothetical protein